MLHRNALLLALAVAVTGINLLTSPVVAVDASPKWFVLRRSEIANCWTAILVRIDGAYRHDSAQIAGGPYDTEAAAQRRETELVLTGTCTKG